MKAVEASVLQESKMFRKTLAQMRLMAADAKEVSAADVSFTESEDAVMREVCGTQRHPPDGLELAHGSGRMAVGTPLTAIAL